jgi:hypothetical protein
LVTGFFIVPMRWSVCYIILALLSLLHLVSIKLQFRYNLIAISFPCTCNIGLVSLIFHYFAVSKPTRCHLVDTSLSGCSLCHFTFFDMMSW